MNIFSIFKNKKNIPVTDNRESSSDKLNERLAEIYGQDTIELQTMYEDHVGRKSWLLKDEALWLISGIDPKNKNKADVVIMEKINNLWTHAEQCVNQGLLVVSNIDQKPEKWEVEPVDIYQWAAVSRVELPDVFTNMMGFVVKSVKQTRFKSNESTGADDNADQFNRDRESVLGMALAILAAYPDQCKSSRGRVKAEKIVSIITEKQEFWLGQEKIRLSGVAMSDLISRWLNSVKQ